MSTPIYVGSIRTVYTSAPFKDPDGNPMDPTTVRIRWRIDDGDETVWVYGEDNEVVRDDVGEYHADITLVYGGLYFARIEGEGSVQAASEETFLVESYFPPSVRVGAGHASGTGSMA